MSRLSVLIAALVWSAGCSDPAGGTSVDASTDSPVAIDAPATPDAPQVTPCGAGQLCLRTHPVVPGATIPNGRLVVVFYQFIDDLDLPFRITYDVPFVGASTSLQLTLAEIGAPAPIDDYRLCPRTCLDLANPACDCPAAQAKITTAFVFVMGDTNSSGGIEPAEVTEENIYGIGYLHLGGADMAYPPPHALDVVLPEGIVNGLAPYRIIDLSPFDKLGIPAPGAVFDLDLCVPGSASCSMLRFPNLT